MKLEDVIYCGDNLEWMRQFPDEFVDLCYIDPPFFSNRHYEVIFKDGQEIRAFEDRWKGGIDHYVEWMRERVFEIHRLLKDTGSFYLHCDYHAVHYLKTTCDGIFGYQSFVNQIVWKRQTAHSDWKQGAKHFGRLHDTILFYVKGADYTWNQQYSPYSQDYVDKFYKHVEPGTGRRYQLGDLAGPGGAAKGNPQYELMGVTRYWRYSKENMQRLVEEGRVVQTKPGAVPRYKRYLDEMPGVALQDFWDDIRPIHRSSNEAQGYPTQKPEALLERIIKGSSNEGDLVFDPFCGCGTTLVIAQRFNRRWLGIDVSPTACKLMNRRLATEGASGVHMVGIPYKPAELKTLKPFEFQNWVVGIMGGTVSDKKSADMGIDGYSFMERDPIQVKQSESVGRNVVDNFETAIRRVNKTKGHIAGFSFTKGAYDEVARAKREGGLDIQLLTVEELVEEYGK